MTKVSSTEKMWTIEKSWPWGSRDKGTSRGAVLRSVAVLGACQSNRKKAKIKARHAQRDPPRLRAELKEAAWNECDPLESEGLQDRDLQDSSRILLQREETKSQPVSFCRLQGLLALIVGGVEMVRLADGVLTHLPSFCLISTLLRPSAEKKKK